MAKRKWTKAQRLALSKRMKAARAAKKEHAALTASVGITTADELPVNGPAVLNAVGYAVLANELRCAFDQSAFGKGKERHANSKPFDRQPIMEIGRMVGPGYATGQAQKKAQEAIAMHKRGDTEKAIFELHGAMVYLAAAAALLREAS